MKVTEEQRIAIESPGNMAVIASAGTGKTTVLTQRFLHCHVVREVPFHNLLAFTFTEKASREMMVRILESEHIAYMQAPQLNISTIHSFCQRLLKQYGAQLGLQADFEIYDEDSHAIWQDIMISRFLTTALENRDACVLYVLEGYGTAHVKNLIRFLLKQDLIHMSPDQACCLNDNSEMDAAQATAFLLAIRDFQETLIQHKIQKQILSYDDLEVLTIRLLKTSESVLLRLQKLYKHILVDEYQDVSPRQFQIISLLFQPQYNSLFIVGDPKQSIYGFRDADVRLFHKTVQLIEQRGGQTVYLSRTFRTPQALQTYFNAVFTHVLGPQGFQPARTEKTDPHSGLYVAPVATEPQNTAERHKSYAASVGEKIHHLIKQGVAPEEIAVLFYAGLPISEYKDVLMSRGIPTVTKTSQYLLDCPVVLVAWQIMKYLGGDHDRVTQVGLLRNEVFVFSETFIDQLIKTEQEDLFTGRTQDLFSHQKDKDNWIRLTQGLKRWEELSHSILATELFQTIVADIVPKVSPHEESFVQSFIHILASWGKDGLYYLKDVLLPLKTLGMTDTVCSGTPANPDGVHLITIHGAKGLEFEHVFLVPGRGRNKSTPLCLYQENKGFVFKSQDREEIKSLQYDLRESDLFAAIKEQDDQRESEELSRLIYVALTRASRCLYFYLDKPSQLLLKHVEQNPDNTNIFKNYNEWLYWLACVKGKAYVVSDRKETIELTSAEAAAQSELGLELPVYQGFISGVQKQPGTTYTVTELETFFHCPKRFQLRYVQGIVPVKIFTAAVDRRNVVPKRQLKPSERGNLFHEILQYYDFEREDNLDVVIDRALFDQHIISADVSIRTECHLFLQKLKQDAFVNQVLFQCQESWPEVEFTCGLSQGILTGQVDRLVRVREATEGQKYLIIDYKTHQAPTPEQREFLTEQFRFQMSCYALALSRHLHCDSLDTLILFTSVPAHQVLRHTRHTLMDFEHQLNELLSSVREAVQTQTFSLTTDHSRCLSCPYFKDNYCGVKV